MSIPNQLTVASGSGAAATAVDSVVAQLKKSLGGQTPKLLLAFASTEQPLTSVMPRLREGFGVPVLGTSTAGEFSHEMEGQGQLVCTALSGDLHVASGIGHSVSANPEQAVQQAVSGLPQVVEGYPFRTAIVFVDSLAYSGEEVTLLISTLLGDVQVAGAAAGDDLQLMATYVGCDGVAATNSVGVAVIFSKTPLGIGVCHGHSPCSRPFRVTRSEGSRVYEIEGKPTWQLWCDVIRQDAQKHWGMDVDGLSGARALDALARYEGGLAGLDGSYKVRAPLVLNSDGSINFTSGIPEGTALSIMSTSREALTNSSRQAARQARAAISGSCAGAIVFDCAVRKMVLADSFSVATQAIASELAGAPVAGFEAYGEIAMNVNEMSGFHNSTTVVLAIPKY